MSSHVDNDHHDIADILKSVHYNVERVLEFRGYRMAHLARTVGRQQSSLARTLQGNVTMRTLRSVAWALGVDEYIFLLPPEKLEVHLANSLIRFADKPPICRHVKYSGKTRYMRAREEVLSGQFIDPETGAYDTSRYLANIKKAEAEAERNLQRYRSVPPAPEPDVGDAQLVRRADAHNYAPPGSGIMADQQLHWGADNNYPGQPAPWNAQPGHHAQGPEPEAPPAPDQATATHATNSQAGGAQTDPQAAQGPTDAQDQAEPSNLEALETALADWEEGTQGPANQLEGTPSTDDDDRIDKSVGAGSAIPFADPSQLEDDIAATAEAERQRYAFDPSVGVDHLGTPLDLPSGWAMAPDATHSFHDYRAVGWLWRQMVDHGVVTPTEQQ